MKIKQIKVSALFLAATLLTTSCVGSFSLFNRVAKWNTHATGSKFLNEIIFILISPAYAVCGVADLLVLNTVEFWSGSNPMAQKVGTTQEVLGKDGRYYAVTTLSDGYEVKCPDGETIRFVYDRTTDSWSQVQDGRSIKVRPDAAGVFETRMAVSGACLYALAE